MYRLRATKGIPAPGTASAWRSHSGRCDHVRAGGRGVPAFVAILRDRRVNNAAMKIVNDAIGLAEDDGGWVGPPSLVNWNSAGNLSHTNPGSPGLIQLIEPVPHDGHRRLHRLARRLRGCTSRRTLRFTLPVNGVQLADSLHLKNGSYDYTRRWLTRDRRNRPSPGFVDICFSPSGLSFVRYGAGTPFNQLSAVPWFQVTNVMSNLTRNVFIPPNGVARLGL